jgi:hypothetical protein
MKAISEPVRIQKSTNCGGTNEWFLEQDFEVEPEDVGKEKDHYLGYRYSLYRFRQADVGRQIQVTSQPGYTCWVFLNVVNKLR